MNSRTYPNIEPLPEAPFFVAFSSLEEAPVYGSTRSFLQQSMRDAYDLWIAPLNRMRADGVLERVEDIPADAPIQKFQVELRSLAQILQHLPSAATEEPFHIKLPSMQNPEFFLTLPINRPEQRPEMIFADTIVFRGGRFCIRGQLDRTKAMRVA